MRELVLACMNVILRLYVLVQATHRVRKGIENWVRFSAMESPLFPTSTATV